MNCPIAAVAVATAFLLARSCMIEIDSRGIPETLRSHGDGQSALTFQCTTISDHSVTVHCWQTCSDYSVMDVCGRCGSLLAPTRIPAPAAAALGSHPGTQAPDAAGALYDRCVCQFLASCSSPNIMRSLSIVLQLCRPSTAVWTAVCQPAGKSLDARDAHERHPRRCVHGVRRPREWRQDAVPAVRQHEGHRARRSALRFQVCACRLMICTLSLCAAPRVCATCSTYSVQVKELLLFSTHTFTRAGIWRRSWRA